MWLEAGHSRRAADTGGLSHGDAQCSQHAEHQGRHRDDGPRHPDVALSRCRHHERQPAHGREQSLLRAEVQGRRPERVRDRPVPGRDAQRPLLGSFQQAFYGGQSPWQYEALFVARAKSVVKAQGVALSRELAELVYDVDYYVHVDNKEDAVKLVTHMPYQGHFLTAEALNAYAGPVVEQAVNQLVQITPLEQVNEKIHEITELVRGHLQDFLSIYGVTLNDVKVLMRPRDERMRELISLRAFGLSELDAVRYYVAMKMAERGLVSAPNIAVGQPFNIGITSQTSPVAIMPSMTDLNGGIAPVPAPTTQPRA
jgi:hypothetical protein